MKREATSGFLPTTAREMKALGWEEADIILFSGDAYIDHPAFGASLLGRLLEKAGFRLAIVPQPNWQDDLRDFRKMGKPRLFFGVTAGAMDSMVNHYTANRRKRSDDPYTPGGKAGFRPDYPSLVYTKALKAHFPDVPVILGGLEASMRRLAHYDYWQNELLPSILYSSGADLLAYGMAERALLELAQLMDKGVPFSQLKNIRQTAFLHSAQEGALPSWSFTDQQLPSFADCRKDKKAYARAFRIHEEESNRLEACRLLQAHDDKTVVVNPAFPPATEKEMDSYYDLPYMRQPHPRYRNKGAIPAWEMIRNSLTIHRGCFGGCSFCAISAHQGKQISSRSENSILNELKTVSEQEGFSGTISDLGGPSANMYRMQGIDLKLCQKCKRPSCIHPAICKNLNTDHSALNQLYRKALNTKGIKRIFIGSGIRYDLLSKKYNPAAGRPEEEYTRNLILKHTSGRLKVAPEHTSESVLKSMRKPSFRLFREFAKEFHKLNHKHGLKQEIIPYFISSHPVCTERDMFELAEQTRELNLRLEQVQDFTPTPMTLSTVMYYTGLDPYSMKPVFVSRDTTARREQNRYFFWYKPENRGWYNSKKKRFSNR